MTDQNLPAYAELQCISNFTFLRGASHPEELVTQAHSLGYAALALTDECSFVGAVRAHVVAQNLGFKLILGTEIKLEDGLKFLLLVDGIAAYQQVSELITRGRRREAKGAYSLHREDIETLVTQGLAIWLPRIDETDAATAAWFADVFSGRAWIGLGMFYEGNDSLRLDRARELSRSCGLPIVAVGDVHAHCFRRQALLDTLTAIRLGVTLNEAGHNLFASSERYLRPHVRLERVYPKELLSETLNLAERCTFSLNELTYAYPHELVPEGETLPTYLRDLTVNGMRRRWPSGAPKQVRDLIDYELKLIAELKYEAYFLTVYDIVEFARKRGILCQGRGSAANSAVCYSLGITEVDPVHIDMLFERFISKERDEPPDIDIDFEHERREEVIQYIYEKYGREHAALVATVVTYKPRSAVRDIGKALGLSLDQVERLSKNMYWWERGGGVSKRLREVGFDPANPVIERFVKLVGEVIGFPRHLSQHVGGFVISNTRLTQLVPIENATMPGRTVIQWDKDDLEMLGILKIDCLCLGMLTAIRRSFELIAGFYGKNLTLSNVPIGDPETYKMIQKADTVGVFQIESRAQMAMLPRLKPACYYDLVIQVAIIRPGPIQGDMVHPYLRRRNGKESVTYPSEAVREVLERTLGVPLFQEQVIKLAMFAAGFSPGKADQLRRSMAKWNRNGGLQEFRRDLLDGMHEHGYTAEFSERIFNQIQGFGEYGFPESHAASFALLAYVSAWLKCHEPAAFSAALLNSQPMGFYAPAQLIQDAVRHGVEIRPVDVQKSRWDCTLEPAQMDRNAPALRLGLRLVKGLPVNAAARIVAARTLVAFSNIADVARRASLDRAEIKALSRAGAFKAFVGNRHQANWKALAIEPSTEIFEGAGIAEGTPMLRVPSEGEDVIADYENLGLTLASHPLSLLRKQLTKLRFIDAANIEEVRHGGFVRTAGLVVTRQRPINASGVVFLTLEDETGLTNLIIWSNLIETYRHELLHARLLGVDGKVQREGQVIHVIARRLEDHTTLLGRLKTYSRDFH